MKKFSILFSVLLFATMFLFSSCEREDPGINVEKYILSQSPPLPPGISYMGGESPNVRPMQSPQPGLNEVFIRDMAASGGVLTVDPNNPSLWSMTIPEKLQQISPRDRNGVCLWGFDYYNIPNAECSSANVFDIDLIYDQGTFSTGKFITLSYPWMKWGENGNLVQSGLQMFADSVYYGLLQIGVPTGFTVCVFATAWDEPTSGNHIYTIHLYVNGVPNGVHVSFMDIFTVNCNGGGYANYDDVDLEINIDCSRTPPSCLAIGGGN